MIPLLAAEISNNTMFTVGGISFLTLIATLIGIHFKLKAYVQDLSGVKETKLVEIRDQPVAIRLHEDYVRKLEHEKLGNRVDKMKTEIDQDIEKLRIEVRQGNEKIGVDASRRTEGMHKRMDVIGENVAGLNERTEESKTRLHLVDQKIDRILERLPRT
ncbi:MAG: hypothetical protein ABI615_11295 [Chthoniobacterales bacterium]